MNFKILIFSIFIVFLIQIQKTFSSTRRGVGTKGRERMISSEKLVNSNSDEASNNEFPFLLTCHLSSEVETGEVSQFKFYHFPNYMGSEINYSKSKGPGKNACYNNFFSKHAEAIVEWNFYKKDPKENCTLGAYFYKLEGSKNCDHQRINLSDSFDYITICANQTLEEFKSETSQLTITLFNSQNIFESYFSGYVGCS